MNEEQYGAAPTIAPPTAPLNPQQVFSAQNVAQTVQAPAGPIDYSDPFKLRDYFYNTGEIATARNDVKNLTQGLSAFDTGTDQQQNYLENQTLAMPVITGQQANQLRLRSTQRDAMARDLLARQSYLDTLTQEANAKYQIASEQRAQVQDLIRQTGGKAKISYADNYETAIGKAEKYFKEEEKKAKKAAEKDALKDMYFQLTGKVAKKGWSSKELKSKVSKAGASQKAIENELKQIELESARVSLAKAKAPSGGVSDSVKGSITEQIYSGKLTREAAKNIYEQTTGKSGDWVYTAAPDGYESSVIGAAAKPPTAAQARANNFYTRAVEASNNLMNVEREINSLGKLGQTQLRYAPNLMKTAAQRQQMQAERQFIEAYLRKDSGAAIPPDEYKSAQETYFPQVGDDSATLAQKKAARQSVLNALANEANNTAGEEDLTQILSQYGIQ